MASKVLVLNAGSSSLKFKVFEELANGLKPIAGEEQFLPGPRHVQTHLLGTVRPYRHVKRPIAKQGVRWSG